MKKIYQLLILCFLLSLIPALSAQKIAKVEAEGKWQIVNITPEKAREYAIEKAKVEAMEKAGVETTITSGTALIISDEVKMITCSNTEIAGEFTDFKVTEEGIVTIEKLNFYRVKISATIKLGTVKNDPEFNAHISGFATTYNEGDKLEFSIKPSKDCSVQIFCFNEGGVGTLLYPNQQEEAQPLKALNEKKFPQSDFFDYTLTKETNEPYESNIFVFVLTKTPRPYLKTTTTMDELYQWIIKIPSDQKLVWKDPVIIGKKGR